MRRVATAERRALRSTMTAVTSMASAGKAVAAQLPLALAIRACTSKSRKIGMDRKNRKRWRASARYRGNASRTTPNHAKGTGPMIAAYARMNSPRPRIFGNLE